MPNKNVTYYVSFEARDTFKELAREYGYRRIPRRVDAAKSLPPGRAPYVSDNTYGIANLIAAMSRLQYEDTRDPLLQATDSPRLHADPPLPPFWYDSSYRRYQWHLTLSPPTRTNLLAISSRHFILPTGARTTVNENTIISTVLEAIGQYSLTSTEPIPVAHYHNPVRYDAGFPTKQGHSSLTSAYYLN
jgi:hypothetical protein